jgi:hypothetical protein
MGELAMLRVEVDTSRFPLVVQTLRFGYTEADMRQALSRYLELFARGQRYALAVHHEPGAPVGDAHIRAVIGAFQAQHEESIRRCNVCVAVVLPSFAHRAAMTGLNWLFPPVTPSIACASLLEAVDTCCERLTSEGMALTPSIQHFQQTIRRQTGYTSSGDSLHQ